MLAGYDYTDIKQNGYSPHKIPTGPSKGRYL